MWDNRGPIRVLSHHSGPLSTDHRNASSENWLNLGQCTQLPGPVDEQFDQLTFTIPAGS